MATEAQVIEYLRKLSQYRERPECDSDGMPHYVDSGNMDDAYGIGETDGGINLAKALIDAWTTALRFPTFRCQTKTKTKTKSRILRPPTSGHMLG